MSMSLAAIPSGRCLKAIRLIERGSVKSVSIEAFSAGNLKPSIGDRIATAAQSVLAKVQHCSHVVCTFSATLSSCR